MKFEWEIIHKEEERNEWLTCTLRAKVIGGWLVRHSGCSTFKSYAQEEFGYGAEGSMVFVPDIHHKWEIS